MPLEVNREGLEQMAQRFRALPEPLAEIGAGLLAPRRRAPMGTFEERQRSENEFKAARDRVDTLSGDDRRRLFHAIYPDQAAAIEAAWQLLMRMPYQSGILRKGFRAPHHPRCTRGTRGRWLNDLLLFTVHHSWDMATLARGVGLRYGPDHMAGIMMAAAMDNALFETLRRVVNGTEPGADIGRQTITALLCCSRPDAWELVDKLLLAAQRQEGLRQIILENIDLAHPEAFRRMLHLMRAEKLTRFAATARALAVWFGMPVDSAEQRRMEGMLGTLIACLENPDRRRQALASTDVEPVYLALWSEAFEDAIAAIGMAAPLLRDDRVERRYAAVHLLVQLALPEATEALADSLADPDLRVALRASAAFQSASGVNCPDAFERLEALLARIPKLRELASIGWDWNKTVADPAGVADLLLTWRADRSFQRFEPHLGMFNPDGRIAVLKSIQTAAKSGGAKGARPIIVELLGDTSSNVREIAFQTIAGVGMLPDDVPAVESLLSRKASDLRRGAIWLLLRQSETARQASAERLAAAADPLMRQAGQEMLAAMKAAAAPVRPPTLEEGLGLIDPNDRTPLATPRTGLPVQLTSDASLRLVESLDALVAQHRETVVHWEVNGNKFQELLGNLQHFPLPGRGPDLPLRELWENWWLNRPADLRDPDGLELLRALAVKEPQSAEYGPAWQKIGCRGSVQASRSQVSQGSVRGSGLVFAGAASAACARLPHGCDGGHLLPDSR